MPSQCPDTARSEKPRGTDSVVYPFEDVGDGERPPGQMLRGDCLLWGHNMINVLLPTPALPPSEPTFPTQERERRRKRHQGRQEEIWEEL